MLVAAIDCSTASTCVGWIEVDDNGFPVRPALLGMLRGRDYDVTYLGYNADGRIGRLGLTASAYYALGQDRASFFTGRKAKIRAGFAAAKPELIGRMAPYRMNVISIVAARGIMAALPAAREILAQRRDALVKKRRALCDWLKDREVPYIEPYANFVMIDVGRHAREFVSAMPRLGVAPGRPFPPLDNMLRVSIGTDRDMQRFREVFWKVYKA